MSGAIRRLVPALALAAGLGCQDFGSPLLPGEGADPIPGSVAPLGEFELRIDPAQLAAGVATAELGIYRELRNATDGSLTTNPKYTIQVVTLSARAPNQNGCPPLTNCFELQITNFYGAKLFDVYMGIDAITPSSGRALLDPDLPAPGGVPAPKGGRLFGDLDHGAASAVEALNFQVPNSSSYTVKGRFWGDDGFQLPLDPNGRPVGRAAPWPPAGPLVPGIDADGRAT